MLKKLVCLPKILFLSFIIIFGITTTSNAAVDFHVPGFNEDNVKIFDLPEGIPLTLPIGGDDPENPIEIPTTVGDVVFSADGNTLYILIGQESAESAVWSVPVTRDPVSGRVMELGTATLFFSFSPDPGNPNPGSIDTSLEFHPSGNGTLFFRTNDVDPWTFLPVVGGENVGQRTSDGTTITLFTADGAGPWGGLAFVPSGLPNAGDLLVGNSSRGEMNLHSLKDNGDGTFEPEFQEPYTNTIGVSVKSFVTGDLHFIPSGSFANDLMFANHIGTTFNDGTIDIIYIDPSTGFPVLETDPNSVPPNKLRPVIIPFASGFGRAGPWGLEFDPITNDLFVSTWEGNTPNKIIQISGFPAPPEPSTISIDIKPRHCPNKLKINKKKGKKNLKVAILGTVDFDVRTIDVDTVRLNGVKPFKPSKAKFKDVTAPSALEPCDCEKLPKDTYEDLVLKFNKRKIIKTLGDVQDGESVPLTLTGNLLDSTLIEGVDCVLIKIKQHGHRHKS